MKQEHLINLPIEWKRGKGLKKADLEGDGKNKCILYGELYTKHKNALIDTGNLSRTNKSGAFYSKKGDILIPGTSTASKKDMLLAREIDEDGVILGGDINIIRPKQGLFAKKYVPYFFDTFSAYDQLDRYITGATGIIHISNTGLKKLKIPLPPLPEQQRIVSILDEAFAAIAKAKSNAEQNLKNAKELFESYLQGVFDPSTRSGQGKGSGWEEKTLKELTIKIGSGATPRGGKESYKSKGISLVRSMNVHDWEFREKNLAFIDEKQAAELNGATLQEEDVLLNITGASVARSCVFPKEYLPARVNQHVSIIRPKKELLDARFLNLLLTSKTYKKQLLITGEQGATRQAITKSQIEGFRVCIPPLEEQQTVVRQLDALRSETQKLEAVYQKKIADLEELKKSILQKAFAGELRT
ncbi:MAG: restriction endonuclease subunit S [Flavobacteriales bacterium]